MTRAVTDILYRTDGQPWASAPVTFERKAGSFDDGSSWPPDEKQATTDATGAYSVQLWPDAAGSLHSRYRVSYPNGETFYVSIPDGTTPISMTEIRIAAATPPTTPSEMDAHVHAADPHAGYLLPAEADLLYAPLSHSQPWTTITGTPATLAGYGITDAYTATQADARYAPIVHSQPWTTISGTPATLAGYGITDAYTATQADARYAPIVHSQPWTTISGTPATLAGYGITDAYTKAEADASRALKANLAGGNTFTGLQTIQTGSAAQIGLIVQGAAAQTADLEQWQDATGGIVARMDPRGFLHVSPGRAFVDPTASSVALSAQPLLTLTADNAQQVSGAYVHVIGNQTAFSHTSTVEGGQFLASGRQLAPGTTSGMTGVTATGETLLDSTGAYGMLQGIVASSTHLGAGGTVTALAGGVFSATLRTAAGNVTDGNVTVAYGVRSGVLNQAANGGVMTSGYAYYANAPVGPGAITAVFGMRIANQGRAGITTSYALYIDAQAGASSTSQAIYSGGGGVRFDTGAVGTIGLILRGMASQTADLQQWQDSTGAIGTRINKAGYIMTHKNTVPANADIATSGVSIWFDPTAGAAKMMFSGKNASGVLVTGSVAMT